MTTIIAHRGASHDAPENTVAAAELAWAQSADAVEIDVRLTRDGHIVVLHDATTQRVAGVNLAVAEHDLDVLRRLEVRSRDTDPAGLHIPTLDEVIATMPPAQRLFIEVKCGAEIVTPLVNMLTRPGHDREAFAIIAFEAATLAAVKAALPGIKAYWLASFRQDEATEAVRPTAQDMIDLCREHGFEGVDLDARGPVDANLVRQLHQAGLECYAWTVNEVVVAHRLVAAGVDGITTDRPGFLRAQLQDAAGG